MGSSASKTARVVKPASNALKNAAPTRSVPGSTSPGVAIGPNPQTGPGAVGNKDAAILRDAADPDFAHMLKSVGPVGSKPRSTDASSESWTRLNPAQKVLYRRQEIAERVEREFEEKAPLSALDVSVIGEIVDRRERGVGEESIEKELGLRKGIVRELGSSVKRI